MAVVTTGLKSILQWNIQSLKTKFSELKTILHTHIPICMCLQETMHGNRVSKPPSDYSIEMDPRDNPHGGVAILIHKAVPYRRVQLNTDLQAIAIQLNINKIYTICNIYLSHENITKRQITNLIDQLTPPYLILGDMNAKHPIWGELTPNPRGNIFEEILLEYPITILNNLTPTHYHIQTNTSSIIDLSIASSDCCQDFEFSVMGELHDSDHYPIELTVKDQPIIVEKPSVFKTKEADWTKFRTHTECNIRPIDYGDINALINDLETVIIQAATESIPKSKGTLKRPSLPWLNNDCKRAKRERVRAERKMKRRYSDENKTGYNRCKARCRYIQNQSRKNFWEEYVSSITQNTTLHQVWKKVQKISGKYTMTPTPVLKLPTGDMIRSHQEVADRMAEAFGGVAGDHNYSPEFLRYKTMRERRNLNFTERLRSTYNEPFTMKELKAALSDTSEKTPGPDQITYSMLKSLHPSLLNILLETFNRIYTENLFPEKWKNAIVIPILKPNKDPSDPLNYRPISLTCCICKLLEKMVNTRLMWYLEKNLKISPIQAGFRKNRSTTDHLMQLENDIRIAIQNRKHTAIVMFDLEKAYDMVWQYGLFERLHHLELKGNLPIFIRNFLTNRKIQVRIGKTLSRPVQLQGGIAQGSVLSCSCFMIAIDNISETIPPSVKATLYVDDLAIYASGSFIETIERTLQRTINNIQTWTKRTGFAFSTAKTIAMHICAKRGCLKDCNLTLNNMRIACKSEHKFLGLIFDSSLTWKPHIQSLKASCHKTLDLLKHLAHKKWGANRQPLLQLYLMLMKPKIDYGCEAYSSACKTYLDSLSALQNSAIRIATGAFRSSPIVSLQAESGIKPLETYREIKILNTLARIVVNPNHPLYNTTSRTLAALTDEEIALEELPKKAFLTRALALALENNLDFTELMLEPPAQSPTWRDQFKVCDELSTIRKRDYSEEQLKALYTAHFQSHANHSIVFTDGSKTRQGTSYATCYGNNIIANRIQTYVSSYTAELHAISEAVNITFNTYGNIVIATDSKSSIQALTKIKNHHPLVRKIVDNVAMARRTQYWLCWTPSHIGIAGNERADEAARLATEANEMHPIAVPRQDFKQYIKRVVTRKWTDTWENIRNNKLKELLEFPNKLKHTSQANREWDIKVTRIRIGHTHLTHSFLMENGARPYCEDCIVPLTVKHFIAECPSHEDNRNQHYGRGQHTLTSMLDRQKIAYNGPLFKYLTDIQLIDKL